MSPVLYPLFDTQCRFVSYLIPQRKGSNSHRESAQLTWNGGKKYRTLTETGNEAVQPFSCIGGKSQQVVLDIFIQWHFTVFTANMLFFPPDILNRAKEGNSLLWNTNSGCQKRLHQMRPCGRKCSVCCVCDYHSPSHALTHTSPAHLHHPRNSHTPWLSLLCTVPCPDLLFFVKEKLIEPCWAITFLFVPETPETNTVGVLLTLPSTLSPPHPSVCVSFTVRY